MKLRLRLMLAFFLFAVLPLAALTLYSYRASARAVREAVASESGRTAQDMEDRMAAVTADLSRRLEQLRGMPPPPEGEAAGPPRDSPVFVGRLLTTLGSTAEFVDSLEIVPLEEEGEEVEGAEAPLVADLPEPPARAAAPHAAQRAVVIDLPRILRNVSRRAARSGHAATAEPMSREDVEKLVQQVGEQLGQTEEFTYAWRVIGTEIEEGERAALALEKKAKELDLKREFACEIRSGDRAVGRLRAQVSSERLLRDVLSRTPLEEGEIPFAYDANGRLYTPDPADLPNLEALGLSPGEAGAVESVADWVVVTREDPSTGLVFGLAHPLGDSLRAVRRTSLRNLFLGTGMALLALLGILPLSHRMTRDLTDVSRGAEELARGNLDVNVPVRSRDEFGQLARVFNQMAGRLKENQRRLVEQERLRKELEMCRQIQSDLLPRAPLRYPFAEVQGISIPARELGGDFFNYFDLPGGEVALLMGDVSGKGVPAALLMANLQATLRARLPIEPDLAAFADRLDREVEASTAVQAYLTLFLSVLDPRRRELRFVNAGHQSPFVVRGDGRLERLDPTGRPIGLLSGRGYTESAVSLEPGDRLFLYTDGLVDAEDSKGTSYGMDRLAAVLSRESGDGTANSLLVRVENAVETYRGGVEAPDDAAMLVLKVGDWLVPPPA